MKTYTLILYKSDGANSCRGCVMEQWGSDFSFDTNVTEEDAVKRIVHAFTNSEYGSYDARLISVRNNEQVIFEFDECSGGWRKEPCTSVSVYTNNEDWDIDDEEGKRINQLIRSGVSNVVEQKRLAEEKRIADKKSEEEKRKETYERQQLEALKQKYENQTK